MKCELYAIKETTNYIIFYLKESFSQLSECFENKVSNKSLSFVFNGEVYTSLGQSHLCQT